MDKNRRAERVMVSLRWLVIAVGLAAASDEMSLSQIAAVVGIVAVYNGALSWCIADAGRFMRYGRRMSPIAHALDIAVITFVTACAGTGSSPAYLMYWFVLVGAGFVSADLRKLVIVTVGVLAANAGAGFYAQSQTGNISHILSVLGIRSAVLVVGSLVSAYIAKTRSQDDLASERGSYLHAILDCGARLTSFRDVHELSLDVLRTLVTETGAGGAQLFLVNEESEELECEASCTPGTHADDGETAGQPHSTEPAEASMRAYASWVMSSGKEFLVHVRGNGAENTGITEHDRPVIAMPLLWQSSSREAAPSVLGVLILGGFTGEDFAADAADILRIFAAISAAAIVNLRLYTNLQKSFLRTLQSLANGLDARDDYTRGHSERVMQVACLIGEDLDLPGESIELLRNASLLHDIGKIGVPDAILRKEGKLTPEEWEAMWRHPVVSEEICRPLGVSPEILFLVKHHHERLDGRGYPDALPAREQPLLQRIVATADSFDAMRSRRPYRDTMREEEVRAELNRAAGRTMDPTVVDALLRLMDRGELGSIYEEHDRMTGSPVRRTKSTDRKAA